MNKTELARELASATGISIGETMHFLEALIEVIAAALRGGKKVKLHGFGVYSLFQRKNRTGRNPKTGAIIHIPGRQTLRFTPGKALKTSISVHEVKLRDPGHEESDSIKGLESMGKDYLDSSRFIEAKVQEFTEKKARTSEEYSLDIQSSSKEKEKTEEKPTVVRIFYGTNREHHPDAKMEDRFGAGRFYGIHYGICDVNIPPDHSPGKIERPHWWKFEFKEKTDSHLMLLEIRPLEEGDFTTSLAERVGQSPEKDLLLFVHGFNVTFAEAARRTAQLAFDLPFDGAPAMFSWPADGKIERYLGDLADAEWSVPCLEQFIELLISHSGARRIHLIAHSMGCLALANTVVALGRRHAGRNLFHNIILAAPDIDRDIFNLQILPNMTSDRLSRRLTLYASSHDKALLISRKIRGDLSRAGEGGAEIIVAQNLDSIDATRVHTDLLGHGYFASTKELLGDIYHTLKNDLPPENRGLRIRLKEALKYWVFP